MSVLDPLATAVIVRPMITKLTRQGDDFELVIDERLLEALEIDAETELEMSIDGAVLVVAPIRDRRRAKELAGIVEKAHERYSGVFERLAE